MRISSDPASEFYFAAVGVCVVLLDGVKQFKCIEADSSEGWCTVWADSDDGSEHIAKLHGNVEILVTAAGASVLRIPNFVRTIAWLHACGKEPKNGAHLNTQVGVHLEEMIEFIKELTVTDYEQSELGYWLPRFEEFSEDEKSGEIKVSFANPEKALDALCDMEVTGNGVAFLAGWDKMKADHLVLSANEAKLVDGKPVILENGKIGKPEGWKPADLSACV